MASRYREAVTPLHSVLIGAYLDTASSFTTPSTGKTPIAKKEFSVGPPRWSQLEHLTCEERLRDQGSFSLEQRWLWGDFPSALQYL